MDKEALGEDSKTILEEYDTARSVAAMDDAQEEFEQTENIVIARLIQVCEDIGCRKLPKGKPPLLSDGEIRRALEKAMDEGQLYGGNGEPLPEKEVAQAQRESDIKWYEGK